MSDVTITVEHLSKRYRIGLREQQHDPEILLIDQVLSVCDAVFQKKCLGKMHDVTQQGSSSSSAMSWLTSPAR